MVQVTERFASWSAVEAIERDTALSGGIRCPNALFSF
jgi:hypothetical protein